MLASERKARARDHVDHEVSVGRRRARSESKSLDREEAGWGGTRRDGCVGVMPVLVVAWKRIAGVDVRLPSQLQQVLTRTKVAPAHPGSKCKAEEALDVGYAGLTRGLKEIQKSRREFQVAKRADRSKVAVAKSGGPIEPGGAAKRWKVGGLFSRNGWILDTCVTFKALT